MRRAAPAAATATEMMAATSGQPGRRAARGQGGRLSERTPGAAVSAATAAETTGAGDHFPGCCDGGEWGVAGLGAAGLVCIHRRAAAGGRVRPTVRIVATAATSARPDLFALVFVFIKSVHTLFLVH